MTKITLFWLLGILSIGFLAGLAYGILRTVVKAKKQKWFD